MILDIGERSFTQILRKQDTIVFIVTGNRIVPVVNQLKLVQEYEKNDMLFRYRSPRFRKTYILHLFKVRSLKTKIKNYLSRPGW